MASQTLAEYAYEYRFSILLFLTLFLIAYHYMRLRCIKDSICAACRLRVFAHKGKKSGYINRTIHGVYYETNDMSFATASDRQQALDVLQSIVKTAGYEYTRDQLERLSDQFVLMILEPETDMEQQMLLARIVVLTDPTYAQALTAVQKAQRGNGRFASQDERQLVYNLLVKYFTTINTPVTIPISRWTDFLLIRTFRTLQLPSALEYSA